MSFNACKIRKKCNKLSLQAIRPSLNKPDLTLFCHFLIFTQVHSRGLVDYMNQFPMVKHLL